MKNLFLIVILAINSLIVYAQKNLDYTVFKGKFNFLICNDNGRNGYYFQKTIAQTMGEMSENGVNPEFVMALGDIHHFNGVQSVQDPLWLTNYENVYSHPELMIDWFPVCGNHEYRGNTEACIKYSDVSRRWEMRERYYTKVFRDDDVTIRVIWLDTTPLISKYRKETDDYPDAVLQDDKRQIEWLDSVLSVSAEDWVIVGGHHPIYAETSKDKNERHDMQQSVDKILCKYHVDMYINGHIHNFQHIRRENCDIDYITNSSASLSRKVKPTEGTVFCSSEPGFSIVSINKKNLKLMMIDSQGNIIHTVDRHK